MSNQINIPIPTFIPREEPTNRQTARAFAILVAMENAPFSHTASIVEYAQKIEEYVINGTVPE